jgi:hypothetical protein
MPWIEVETRAEREMYPSGWRWERPDADPVTQMLPIIPPLEQTPLPKRVPQPVPPRVPDLPPTAEPVAPLGPPSFPSLDLPLPYEKQLVEAPTSDNQEKRVKLSREPALLYIGLLAPVVQAVAAFVLNASPTLQGAVNALAVALAGAITAALVRADNLVPAITGAFQAVLALVLALGWDLTSEQQATVMVAVGAIAAVVVRDRVVAPVPAAVASTGVAA